MLVKQAPGIFQERCNYDFDGTYQKHILNIKLFLWLDEQNIQHYVQFYVGSLYLSLCIINLSGLFFFFSFFIVHKTQGIQSNTLIMMFFKYIYIYFFYDYDLWLTSKMHRYGDKRIYIYNFYSHNNGGWLKSFSMDDGEIYIYIYIYIIFNVMGTDDLVTQGARASAIMILIYSHQTAAAC